MQAVHHDNARNRIAYLQPQLSAWNVGYFLLSVLLIFSPPLYAATFEVDTTVDDPSLTECTDTPNLEDCSFRGAVEAARVNFESDDIVLVPSGIYQIGQEIAIALAPSDTLRIDAFGAILKPTASRGLFIDGGRVEINGLTVEGGIAVDGGGINVNQGIVTLSVVRLLNNAATLRGGGLYIERDASVISERLFVIGNTAELFGGGIEVRGTLGSTRLLFVQGNSANRDGGGLHFSGGIGNLQHANIRENMAVSAGGVGLDLRSTVTIENSIPQRCKNFPP